MLRGFSTLVLALTAGAAGPGQPVAEPAPAIAFVRVVACSPALGNAVFYGRMRSLAAGERMSMRFTLLERTERGRYHPVRAPKLGRWRRSRPGVAVFGYRQKVRGLDRGAVYRARVDFRWHDADGELVRRAQRRSGPCSQLGPLPNLRARILRSEDTTTPGVFRYTVRASNAGNSAAHHVAVGLEVDGSAVDTKSVPLLQPGRAETLEFRGPGCETSVRAVADPENGVRESSEHDNAHTLTCAQLPRG
jgi:CARDB